MGAKQRTKLATHGIRDGIPFGQEDRYLETLGIRRMQARVLVAFCAAWLAEGRPLSGPEIEAGTRASDDPVKGATNYTAPLERAGLIERAGRVEGTRTSLWKPTRRGLRLLGLEAWRVAA